ncbi:3-deoxy-manno-octulosonate cytidylyltransferase [bacterium]|nr:3-deoxy-manno-octulosonate cytidylyltransferase [bacterium]
MRTLIVIPARLSSQRLSEKLLLKIHNLEIICWVAKAVQQTGMDYVIAVDDLKLSHVLGKIKANFIMTKKTHRSGTERLTEVRQLIPNYEYYCMVQGDEPLIGSRDILDFIDLSTAKNHHYVQAVTKFQDGESPIDSSNVKVVLSKTGKILYASRSIIPFNMSGALVDNKMRQISGLYLFKAGFLEQYKSLGEADLETIERIEQLRCLYNEVEIDTVEVNHPMMSIDTLDDYERIASNSIVVDDCLKIKT